MRRNHLDAVAAQLLIEWIAVVSAIADEVLWLGLDHVEVETELNQTHFVVVGRMRTDRERQAMAIHNRHDFQALSPLRRTDLCAAALGHRKGRVDDTLLHSARRAREARWRCRSKPGAESRCDTRSGSADAQFCSSDSTAAACATARRCSKSKAPLQAPHASEQAYGPDGDRECSPPESAPGCVHIPNQAVESSTIYSGSTPILNFEIGSSHWWTLPLIEPRM